MINLKSKYLLGLLSLILGGCTVPLEVFDQESFVENQENSVGNFHSTEIFADRMSDEVWSSEEGDCLVVTQEDSIIHSGNGALHVKWDKISMGCPWLGMGFGWDGWAGKNFSSIYEKSAIQFKIRTAKEDMKSLPVAFCLEDYGNVQAWTGFTRGMLATENITKEWNTVTIPLLSFNWEEFEADITNIKQFMIQFEAAGDVYIDDMKIVPHKGNLKKQVNVLAENKWQEPFYQLSYEDMTVMKDRVMKIEENFVTVFVDKENLYVAAFIEDTTPLENAQDGKEIWNGDAIEIAFSTNAQAPGRRQSFLISDHQIGIRASRKPMVWDWKKQTEIKNAEVYTYPFKKGYQLSATVPLTYFGSGYFIEGETYGLEVAIDQGTINGRQVQLRWNSPDVDGFYKNPSVWGEMLIKKNN